MIPYTTCLGFHCGPEKQRWHCFPDHPLRRDKISLKRTIENHLHIKIDQIPPPIYGTYRCGKLTSSECALLETLDLSDHRQRTTGKFLTLNRKRRRVPLSLELEYNSVYFEDIYHGQTQCALRQADKWPFNAFILDAVTGGRSLPVLLMHLFTQYDLIGYFELDVVKVWKCFNLIEEGYHSNNPYHNAIHASDVSQAMHCFLQEEKIAQYITPIEIMAALIAAVTHDLDHPGVNQPFLIATSNHLATLYENSSVLENHHWRSAVACLMESGIFNHIGREFWNDLIWQVRSLILATDITRQQEFLNRFKRYMDMNLLDMREMEYRHFILQIALKCADICNPCRPWIVSKIWSDRVCEEFFRQGDFERQLNLPVTSLCDRFTMSKPKIQAGFFRFVVAPLFEAWDKFQQTSMSEKLVQNLKQNQTEWEKLANEENNKMIIENSEEINVDDDDTDDDLKQKDLSTEKCSDKETFNMLRGRRHSMPLSLPKTLPQTIIRRKSVATSRTLSAEALVPDSRITSISAEASRLAGLFTDRKGNKHLVKQMTYPPVYSQPHIHSQSWQEACAELLPGVISSSVLQQTESETPVKKQVKDVKRKSEKSPDTFPKNPHSSSGKTVAFHLSEIVKENPINESNNAESKNNGNQCGLGQNGCGTPPSSSCFLNIMSEEAFNNCNKNAFTNGMLDTFSIHFCTDSEAHHLNKHNKENTNPLLKTRSHYFSSSSEGISKSDLLQINMANSQMFPYTTGRRGSAPVSVQHFGEELFVGLRGKSCSSTQWRRGSMPNDTTGIPQFKKSVEANAFTCRRNSLPLTSFNRYMGESSDVLSTKSDAGNSRIALRDKQFKSCAFSIQCSFNADPFSIRRRLHNRRSSMPLELLESSESQRIANLSPTNQEVIIMTEHLSTVSKPSGIEILNTLFKARSHRSAENMTSTETTTLQGNKDYSCNLHSLTNLNIYPSLKQSESFDLGILSNNEFSEIIDENEFWGLSYNRRRGSVPVDVCLLPNTAN